jgi:hypothetical protein
MTNLENWISENENAVTTVGSIPGFGDLQPSDSPLSQTTAREGLQGVLLLLRVRRHATCLRVQPLGVPHIWPGVIVKNGQALPVATDARTLLPQLVVHLALSNAVDTAHQLAELWTEIGEKVAELHRVLGGIDSTLNEVITTVSDPVSRDVFKYVPGQEKDFEAAHSTLCRKIDNSEWFVRYADWLDACAARQWTTPEDPPRYGVWSRRVLCWASRLALVESNMPRLPTDWVHQILEGNAGLDSGVPNEVSWSVQAGAASGETMLVEAASSIEHETPSTDPIRAGILKALLTEGTSYRGLAHAEATVTLDEQGEPERAWEALQGASWWAARNLGEVPQSMLAAARFLADRHGWADVSYAVERNTTSES